MIPIVTLVVALLFTVLSFIFPEKPLMLKIAVLLICAALLIPSVVR